MGRSECQKLCIKGSFIPRFNPPLHFVYISLPTTTELALSAVSHLVDGVEAAAAAAALLAAGLDDALLLLLLWWIVVSGVSSSDPPEFDGVLFLR